MGLEAGPLRTKGPKGVVPLVVAAGLTARVASTAAFRASPVLTAAAATGGAVLGVGLRGLQLREQAAAGKND